jgi:hypothetical protein
MTARYLPAISQFEIRAVKDRPYNLGSRKESYVF